MRRYFIGFCIIVLLLLLGIFAAPHTPLPATAQEDESEWFFVQNRLDGQIAALNVDGTLNVLFEAPDLQYQFGVQFNSINHLLSIEDDEGTAYFHVTPTSVEAINFDLEFDWWPVAQSDHYAALHGSRQLQDAAPTVVYDAETRAIQYLAGIIKRSGCCVFTAEGTKVRYISYISEEAPQWTLLERNLETGEDTLIFHPDVPFDDRDNTGGVFFTDTYGERWLWSYFNRDSETGGYYLIRNDGSIETLDEFDNESNPRETIWYMRDDFLIERPVECEEGCLLSVYRENADPVQLRIPSLVPVTLSQVNTNQFLVADQSEYWLVSSDGEPTYIGEFDPIHMFTQEYRSIDGQYIILVSSSEESGSVVVWDLEASSSVYELSATNPDRFFVAAIYHSPNGLIIYFSNDSDESFHWLEYESGAVVTLPTPEDEFRNYYAILEDGALLFTLVERDPNAFRGIWRYDPTTDSATQVGPDGFWEPLIFRDLR